MHSNLNHNFTPTKITHCFRSFEEQESTLVISSRFLFTAQLHNREIDCSALIFNFIFNLLFFFRSLLSAMMCHVIYNECREDDSINVKEDDILSCSHWERNCLIFVRVIKSQPLRASILINFGMAWKIVHWNSLETVWNVREREWRFIKWYRMTWVGTNVHRHSLGILRI